MRIDCRKIGLDSKGVNRVLLLQLSSQCFQPIEAARYEGNIVAFRRKRARKRGADPGGRPCYQC